MFKTVVQPPTATNIPPEPPDGKVVGENNANGKAAKEIVSFRDKVLGNQSIMEREKVDLLATNKAKVELVQGNRLLPMLHVENSVIDELSVPWKDALVVKLLGKSLGYNVMKAKLENVWKLTGGFELMDVGNSYYMVKFDGLEDKNKVINGGPWMIYDHILAVSQWSSKFNATTATIDKTMVWIRIPSLNLVYYDESLLWALASMVGNPVKVDLHTLKVARGRFARMCVEIDLTKPVVGRVGINGDWYRVQYEGLHIICTHCGCYGHVLKDCGLKIKSVMAEKTENSGEGSSGGGATVTGEKPGKNQTVNHGVSNEEISTNPVQPVTEIPHDFLHGDWIKVERRKRNNKINARGFSGVSGNVHNQHSNNAILNMVEKLNRQYPVQKKNGNVTGSFNAMSKNHLKKKRPRNGEIQVGPISKTVPLKFQVGPSQNSHGVNKGGYTATKGKMGSGLSHVERPNSKQDGGQHDPGPHNLDTHEVQDQVQLDNASLQHNQTGAKPNDMESKDKINVELPAALNGKTSKHVHQDIGENIMGLTHDTNMILN